MENNPEYKIPPDLTKMARQIENVLIEFLNLDSRPVIAVAFSCPPVFDDVHWVTNVDRDQGILLFVKTAEKMQTAPIIPSGPEMTSGLIH